MACPLCELTSQITDQRKNARQLALLLCCVWLVLLLPSEAKNKQERTYTSLRDVCETTARAGAKAWLFFIFPRK
jgi:hypothetical protein